MKKIASLLFAFSIFAAEEEVSLLEPSLKISPSEFEMPAPKIELPKKNSFMAVTLSVIPGLGHLYLGDYATAGELFGSAGLLIGASTLSQRYEGPGEMDLLVAASNLCNYTIYAAYRDVRNFNRQEGYAYKMPNETLQDLTTAPFRPSVLKKPEVWGGVLGALAAGVAVSYLAFPHEMKVDESESGMRDRLGMSPFAAIPIGIGEESLFRGFLQPMLSERLTPWGGLIASSAAFGAVHASNSLMLPEEERWRYYAFSIPLITSLGAYLGWVSQKNHSLKECVAIHAWYDFALLGASALATRASIGGFKEFSWSISF